MSAHDDHMMIGTKKSFPQPLQIPRLVGCCNERMNCCPRLMTWHYGIFVLLLAGSINFCSAAGSTFGIGHFTENFLTDLQLSRSQLSAAWTCAMLATAIALPFVGRSVDRFGPRRVMFVVTVGYATALLTLSFVHSLWHIFLSFTLLRICMASTQLIAQNVTNQWFVKRRAFAMVVANTTGSLSLTYPSFLTVLDTRFGWRGAFIAQSLVIGGALLLVNSLMYNRPETYGLLPDNRGLINPAHGMVDFGDDDASPAAAASKHRNGRTGSDASNGIGGGSHSRRGSEQQGGGQLPDRVPDDDESSVFVIEDPSHPDDDDDGIGAGASGGSSGSGSRRALEAIPLRPMRMADSSDAGAGDSGGGSGHSHGHGGSGSGGGAHSLLPTDDSDAAAPKVASAIEIDDAAGSAGAASPAAAAVAGSSSAAASGTGEVHFHWKDALRTRVFWVVTLSACSTSTLWSGFNFHFLSIFEDHGIPQSTGDFIFLPVSVGSAVVMFAAGYMFDKIKVKARGMMMGTVSATISLALLITMKSVTQAVFFAVMYGIMDGILSVGYATVFAYTFGRVHLGTIDSFASAFSTFAIGLGALLFGLSREFLGSYNPLLFALMGITSLLSVLLFFSKPPAPPARSLSAGDH